MNAEGSCEPFSIDEVPWEHFSHGERFAIRFRMLGDYGGGSHLGVGLEVLEPGKRTYPAHYHMLEEEHVLVLEGTLGLRLGGRSYRLSAGDYVCFPAGQKAGHTLFNDGKEPCRYLIIGERNPHDVVVFTDSNSVRVHLLGEQYDRTKTMKWGDGEESGPRPPVSRAARRTEREGRGGTPSVGSRRRTRGRA